jgi:hypothetical protein
VGEEKAEGLEESHRALGERYWVESSIASSKPAKQAEARASLEDMATQGRKPQCGWLLLTATETVKRVTRGQRWKMERGWQGTACSRTQGDLSSLWVKLYSSCLWKKKIRTGRELACCWSVQARQWKTG